MTAQDDHRHGAWLATLSALIVVASFMVAKAGRDAILLASYSIKSLPIFIGIAAVISLPIILVAGKLMTRWGPATLIPVVNVLSAGLAVAEWLFLARYPRVVSVVIFFHLSTSGAVLVSGFWSIVNERFDVQSAKRHIGRIGMGATLGGILGGVIAERTAVLLPADSILLVMAGLQLMCAAALYLFARGGRSRATVGKEAGSPGGTWSALGLVSRSQLLRNVGIVVILGAVVGGIIDYVFKADIVAGGSKDGLLRSLAIFYTVTNVVTAVLQAIICGPLIAKLGVPRSVATLPITVTIFGLAALVIPLPVTATLARGAELVTRNSLYRSAYELLFAPLPEEHKRPTKVILDVGADKIGDLLGAQLVGVIVMVFASPRFGLLIALVVISALALMFAMRLPHSYTKALEESLLAQASDVPVPAGADQREPWMTLDGFPSFGSPGDAIPLRRRARRVQPAAPPAAAPLASAGQVFATLDALRSGDVTRIKRALAEPVPRAVAAFVIDLVGRDDVAKEALSALALLAPKCTGILVDALLDQERDATLRRRLPAVIVAGDPSIAALGLWRGLDDPSFDVRYRCGAVLSKLGAAGHLSHLVPEQIYERVLHELAVTTEATLRELRAAEDLVDAAASESPDAQALPPTRSGLEHVFTVLGLVLPQEPLRIAHHAVQTDDPELRATALEYLESILPADVRSRLWPLIEGPPPDAIEANVAVATDPATPATRAPLTPSQRRSQGEILEALSGAYPTIQEKLRARAKPS